MQVAASKDDAVNALVKSTAANLRGNQTTRLENHFTRRSPVAQSTSKVMAKALEEVEIDHDDFGHQVRS